VQRLHAQRRLPVRIEDDQVGVAAHGNGPLAGEQSEHPRRRRRDQLDEAVQADAAGEHAAVMDQRQARLDAGGTIGDLAEVVLPQLLLLDHAEGAMVGRDHLQIVLREPLPQHVLVPSLAQRGRHHVLGALEAGLLVVVVTEEQVLRAGLGVGRQPQVARLLHLLERVRRREMNDVDRHAGHLGERDGAASGLPFRPRRPREGVVLRRRLPPAQRLLHQLVDHAAVLGVHADEAAVLPRPLQRAEDRLVVHHEDARIGHEQLEAGDPLVAHHPIHLAEPGVLELGQDHVEAVVDHCPAIGPLPPVVQRMPHRLAAVLDGEIDDAGGAAEGSGHGARLEVVGRGGATERHVQVGVNVDAARHDVLPRGVDRAVGLEPVRRQVLANGPDDSILAVHIGDVVVRRRNHPSVRNQQRHDSL
jgi:hypothetical protein